MRDRPGPAGTTPPAEEDRRPQGFGVTPGCPVNWSPSELNGYAGGAGRALWVEPVRGALTRCPQSVLMEHWATQAMKIDCPT